MPTVLILAGTKKGLFLLRSEDRIHWRQSGPFLKGKEVNHATLDPRSGRIFATSNDAWFGCTVDYSDDLGQTWTTATKNPAFAPDSGLSLERLWHIEPGRKEEPGVLYAGVAPAALFRSTDNGHTWTEIESLTQHPTRDQWNPGAGGMCLHSIVVDPTDAQRMYVGISAAGVFRSEDGGGTWVPANRGTRAGFLAEPFVEVGQCVHKLLGGVGGNGLLFQQNHCGVYRSADAGRNWTEITEGLPSEFGFPLGVHPHEASTIFVLPLQGPEFRCPPDGKLRVYRSKDGGDNWEATGAGLPDHAAYGGVYRECMAVDTLAAPGLYFGTNTGKIYGTVDQGDNWTLVQDDLPPIYSVEAGVLGDA